METLVALIPFGLLLFLPFRWALRLWLAFAVLVLPGSAIYNSGLSHPYIPDGFVGLIVYGSLGFLAVALFIRMMFEIWRHGDRLPAGRDRPALRMADRALVFGAASPATALLTLILANSFAGFHAPAALHWTLLALCAALAVLALWRLRGGLRAFLLGLPFWLSLNLIDSMHLESLLRERLSGDESQGMTGCIGLTPTLDTGPGGGIARPLMKLTLPEAFAIRVESPDWSATNLVERWSGTLYGTLPEPLAPDCQPHAPPILD